MNKTYPNTTIVDEQDNITGEMQLFDAMASGKTLRVSHVLVLNSKGLILLQRRGPNVLAPNLWNAAAAGHVDAGDDYQSTAVKELQEEMGLTTSEEELNYIDKFLLPVKSPKGDHAKFHAGFYVINDGEVTPEPEEVSEVRWEAVEDLQIEITKNPGNFTEAFVILAKKYIELASE